MIVLGIETSCDETAVCLMRLTGGPRAPKVLSQVVASQHEIHTPYGGIYPELASRRHIEVLQPLTEEALSKAGIGLRKVGGIAVTYAPGLVGSLLIGLSFAKAMAYALEIPFVGVSHLEGHLNAPLLEYPLERARGGYPQIGLVVSGGHTALYLVKKFGEYKFLGGTRDDAAGEAFDKVAKLIGLVYPGGPEIDRLAREGDPAAIRFPRPRLPRYDFSFSGLKTAVRERVRESYKIPDLSASFQETVVDHLIEKTLKAASAFRCKTVVVSGGVACNSRLRQKMEETCRRGGRRCYFPSPRLCTDNAAMIAYVGGRYLMAGRCSPLSLNAVANLDLTEVSGQA